MVLTLACMNTLGLPLQGYILAVSMHALVSLLYTLVVY